LDLRRLRTFAGLTLVALLAAAAPAHAEFTVASLSAAPADPRAAANSDFTIAFRLGGNEQIKDLDLDLPPGVVGNPNNTGSRCSEVAFNDDACPVDSAVGTTTVESTATVALAGVPITASGTIYNLEPRAGEPARLGIVVRPAEGFLDRIYLQSPVSARTTKGDVGLRSTLRDMPRDSKGVPIRIDAISLTLNGAASNGPFMRNPTSCDPATTRISATSYDATNATGSGGFTPTDCASVLFAPRLGAIGGGKGNTGRRAHPGLTTTVAQEATEGSARSVTVKLPPLLAPDLTVLQLCEPDQAVAHTCPATSKVGEAQAFTPLLASPLTGGVFITRNPVGLPQLTVDLQGLLAVQLTGDVALVGGIATTFSGIPDVPLSQFVLRFNGGPGGLIQTSADLCTAKDLNLTGTFAAYSGKTTTTQTPLRVEGCGPAMVVGARALAGRKPVVSVNVTRHATGEKLTGVELTLPRGLKLDRRALARGMKVTAGGRSVGSGHIKASGRKITIALPAGTTADSLRIALRGGAVHADSKLRKRAKRRPNLAFVAVVTDAKGDRVKLTKTIRGR
jgi:hypothetical protein